MKFWWKVFREEKEPVILKRVSANGCACGFGKIKNDSGFIECIFAAKAARELSQEEVTVSDRKPSDSGAVTPDLSLEEIKKTDVVEQIISEAEEKAFKENA